MSCQIISQTRDTRRDWCTHVQHGELGQNSDELFLKRVRCKLDLAHVKVSYPADFEVFVDNLVPEFSTSSAVLP